MIRIFRGDDARGAIGHAVSVTISAPDISAATLAQCTASLWLCGVRKDFAAPIVSGETRTIEYTAAETAQMPLGTHYAVLRVFDADGNVRTADNTIRALVTRNVAEVYDSAVTVTIGGGVAWAEVTGKPTTAAGYGITMDTTPAAGSANPVTSGGVASALAQKQDALTISDSVFSGGENPATSTAIMDYFEGVTAAHRPMELSRLVVANVYDEARTYSAGAIVLYPHAAIDDEGRLCLFRAAADVQRGQIPGDDGAPWQFLNVAMLLADKQDALTFDETPTEDSTNPVTSGGVYAALSAAGRAAQCVIVNEYFGFELEFSADGTGEARGWSDYEHSDAPATAELPSAAALLQRDCFVFVPYTGTNESLIMFDGPIVLHCGDYFQRSWGSASAEFVLAPVVGSGQLGCLRIWAAETRTATVGGQSEAEVELHVQFVDQESW